MSRSFWMRSLFQATGKTQSKRTKCAALGVENLETRLVPYSVTGNAWPHPALVTISFVPDGTPLTTSTSGTITSNLFSTFNAKFGSAAAWQNQILKAAQVWAQQTNINFSVVSDSGASAGSGSYEQGNATFGDVRIGGYNFNNSSLAVAYMPPQVNNYSIAGDIAFNTSQTFNIGATYDLFTVTAHEFGHALGLDHSTNAYAVMYAAYNGVKSSLYSDDVSGIQAIYSNGGARSADAYDAAASNNSLLGATNLNSLINASTLTALTGSADITTTSDVDWYTFTAPANTTGTMKVQMQSKGLSLLSPKVTVYAADGSTVLGSASGLNQYGATLTVTINCVSAGQRFYVKAQGADTTAFSTGAYALALNFGNNATPVAASPNTQTANGSPLSGGGGIGNKKADVYLVNQTVADIQQTSSTNGQDVAMDAQGNFVVVWSSNGEDGSGYGVYGRRYDVNGAPRGGEFRVNTTTTDDQLNPAVASDANGDFVVVWQSHLQDGSGYGIYGQRYDASGARVGGEFQVNTTTLNDQREPSVAMNDAGSFVVAWTSIGQDGSQGGIYAQAYDVNGNRWLGESSVNVTTTGDQQYPAVAMDGLGDYIVTWSSQGQDSGGSWGVYGRLYLVGTLPSLTEFRVNTIVQNDQMCSRVAMDSNGNFTIAWQSMSQDGQGLGIYARRYNMLGLALGGEFQVNTTTASDQKSPSLAMDTNGNFLITWSSNGQDGSGWGIYGQLYNGSGVAQGGEFLVNAVTQGDQVYPSAAMDDYGHAVMVWSGAGVGDDHGVFGQLYVLSTSNLMAIPSGDADNVDTFDVGRTDSATSDIPVYEAAMLSTLTPAYPAYPAPQWVRPSGMTLIPASNLPASINEPAQNFELFAMQPIHARTVDSLPGFDPPATPGDESTEEIVSFPADGASPAPQNPASEVSPSAPALMETQENWIAPEESPALSAKVGSSSWELEALQVQGEHASLEATGLMLALAGYPYLGRETQRKQQSSLVALR